MSDIPWPTVALLGILIIGMSRANWLYLQYRKLRDRWGRAHFRLHKGISKHPEILLWVSTGTLTLMSLSDRDLWIWPLMIRDGAPADPDSSTMLKAVAALLALFTFAATSVSSLSSSQDAENRYLGRRLRTDTYARTIPSAALATRSLQVIAAGLLLAPITIQYLPSNHDPILHSVTLLTGHNARLLVITAWMATFVTAAAILTWNVLTVLRLAARQVQWSKGAQGDIENQVHLEYRADHDSLLVTQDYREASKSSEDLTRNIVHALGLIPAPEAEDQQSTLLCITINSRDRLRDFRESRYRVVKALNRPNSWSRRLPFLRASSPAVLNGILDGRRDTLIRAATDADLPGPTRSSLLHRVLQDVQDADALIRDLLEADAALTEPMMGRTTTSDKAPRVRADDFSGLLTLKDDNPWYSSRSLTRRAEADESRYLERVPLAAYRELAKQITGHPCRLTSAQVKAILNSRFISETFPHGDSPWGMLHDRTAATARSIIIEALLSATITNRAEDETLPLSTVRDLMGWERGVDHDLLDEAEQQDTPSLRAEVRMRAQHRLQLTPILTPAEHAELLGYSSSATVSLTALLHMLLYYGRSGRAVRGEDLAPFYKQIHRELRFRDSFPADAVEHTSDVLRVSHVSHIVAPDDVAWLYDVVKEPLTCNTFTELDHHRAAGLDLSVTNLCLWWAIVNPGERARRIGLAMPDTLDSRGQRRLIDAVGRAVQILDETHIDNLMGIASWLRDELPEPYDEDYTGR